MRAHGLHAWLSARPKKAYVLWNQSLKRAEALQMPLEQALTYYELGRHLSADDPLRRAQLERAQELFQQQGVCYYEPLMQEAWKGTRTT